MRSAFVDLQDQVSQIEAAFADVPTPIMTLDGLLDEHEPRDDLWITAFVGCAARHWKELHSNTIEAERQALTALNPNALLFFLPAYLRQALLTKGKSEVTDSVIYFLDVRGNEAQRRWKKTRFELLSRAQIATVVHFLEAATGGTIEADAEAAAAALESYWNNVMQIA